MDQIKIAYELILNNYKTIETNNKATYQNIKKVDNVYEIYINSEQIDSVNYSIYIDDIKHQVDITLVEYKYSNEVNNLNIVKLYRDLFKMYSKIIKSLLNIYQDNKIMVMKIWNSNIIFPNETNEFRKIKSVIKIISQKQSGPYDEKGIFDAIKKYYYLTIKIINEVDEIEKMDYDTINILFNEICKRMDELNLSSEFVNINLIDIKDKTNKGIIGQSYIMDLEGKINKIKTEYNTYVNILNSIFNIHTKLSDKYMSLSTQILDDITYDDKPNSSPISNKLQKMNSVISSSDILSNISISTNKHPMTPSKHIMESINKLSDNMPNIEIMNFDIRSDIHSDREQSDNNQNTLL